MLTKKRQQKRFEATGESMLTHVAAFIGTRNSEALHHFRVQVKKWKALLLFLQEVRKGDYASGPLANLQLVFKHGGRIRSAQITLGLLERYSVAEPDYRRHLEAVIIQETDQFCAKSKDYVRFVNTVEEAFSREFQALEDQSIEILYQRQLKKLSRFFSLPILGDEELHDVRRRIKNLLFLYKILPEKLIRKIRWNDYYLDQLQHLIGEFHDTMQLLEFLKKEGCSNQKAWADIQREKGRRYREIRWMSGNFSKKAVY